mmetsp:Transcript_29707/g.54129  ORF Transcript_29707/g.54129 Transcript_29707/m.54129 type:complete len:270 (-) Transcript_29707:665-1474(-)
MKRTTFGVTTHSASPNTCQKSLMWAAMLTWLSRAQSNEVTLATYAFTGGFDGRCMNWSGYVMAASSNWCHKRSFSAGMASFCVSISRKLQITDTDCLFPATSSLLRLSNNISNALSFLPNSSVLDCTIVMSWATFEVGGTGLSGSSILGMPDDCPHMPQRQFPQTTPSSTESVDPTAAALGCGPFFVVFFFINTYQAAPPQQPTSKATSTISTVMMALLSSSSPSSTAVERASPVVVILVEEVDVEACTAASTEVEVLTGQSYVNLPCS